MGRALYCWDDLRPFGIDALTGEACGLSMRLLCDVTAAGRDLIERFFGGTITIAPGSNWNGGSKDDPHVGSVLLPRDIFESLAAFALVVTGTTPVAIMKDGHARELRAGYPEDHIRRYVRRSSAPGTGDRNQHAMSGRIE
jgi:hypothetical protein